MKWQFRFLFINFFAALVFGWGLGQLLIDPATHPVWFGLVSGGLAAVLIRFLNYVTLLTLQWLRYGLKVDELLHDAEEATNVMHGKAPPPIEQDPKVGQLDFRIVKKARKPLGKFMDEYFYEWIEVARGGEVVRLKFEGTLDLKKATVKDIPADCLVLPPGIIYKPQT
jgi:hypothetical protein